MKLSHRLKTVASFVIKGSNIADIGTDHGYIPIYLVSQGIANHAIAMDVRDGPLLRAASHIREHGLKDKITVRLSDGLKELQPGEANCVIIAGMGGELMIRILDEGKHLWSSVDDWVLSPQSDPDQVRMYLEKQGFSIREETMVKDEGKYYIIIKVARGSMAYGRMPYYKYGKLLITEKHPVLKEYLKLEEQKVKKILNALESVGTQTSVSRRQELHQELMWIKEAIDEMQ